MKLCSGMTKNGYENMLEKGKHTLIWMSDVEYGIATIGLVVVFGFYRKQTKPTFVKVIWAFITLGIINEIAQRVFDKNHNNLPDNSV